MAPIAKLQKHKHELELAKVKITCQEDLIKELTKERDFLKEQLVEACGPKEVIVHYQKVLKLYKKKHSIIAACKIVGVDCNTIVLNAPIAELSIAAPEKFAELEDKHTRKHKLGDFAGKCLDAICDSPDIASAVTALKKSGKPLPVGRGNY
ncbi:coiled-coil domain-containing protein 106-like [Chaetodon auriga]|uniref:coiled-coil domain-containing protein 106-like n=1 Tax=Chaetodon auriga TaxID=39042 RepID=UPI004032ACDC